MVKFWTIVAIITIAIQIRILMELNGTLGVLLCSGAFLSGILFREAIAQAISEKRRRKNSLRGL